VATSEARRKTAARIREISVGTAALPFSSTTAEGFYAGITADAPYRRSG
jgi:hypothetical protein